MVNVSIISTDIISPAPKSAVHEKPPYKLCIFDQLTPVTYVPIVLFYPKLDPNIVNIRRTLSQLKTSLSPTLSVYYPFSGRVKDNLYIDDFDAGVPYLEARINCSMSEFLELQEIELYDQFVPFPSRRKETASHHLLPLLGVQVTVFDCSGIAIGLSISHKIFDGVTANTLYKHWAAVFRGDHDNTLLHPNLYQASLTFPPKHVIQEKYLAFLDRLWFQENKFAARRFVFNANAIDTLRRKAKSEAVPNPTRIEALICFLWKHAMAASRHGSTSRKASIAVNAVNMRPRLKQPMPENTIGNIFWGAPAAYIPSTDDDTESTDDDDELCDLVKLVHDSIKRFDKDYLEPLQGVKGFGQIFETFDVQQEIIQALEPEVYTFTSWTKILNEVDFGWGKPLRIGGMGKPGPTCRKIIVFVQTQWSKSIEAWVTLEERQIAIMEKDPQFLAFADPNLLSAKQ